MTTLIADAGVDDSTQVGAVALGVYEGTIYTVLSALGPVTSVIANVGSTAVSAAGAAQPGVLSSPFAVAAGELQGELANRFQALLDALNSNEQIILTDASMMEQVAALTSSSDEPDSLAFDSSQESAYLRAAAAGYAVAAMQILLPAKYQLYATLAQTDATPLIGPDSWDQWVETLAPDALFNKFQISTGGKFPGYPSQAAMETDVFGNGATPHDFYYGTNGWEGFYPGDRGGVTSNISCYGQVVSLTNYTPNSLDVTVTPNKGRLGGNGVNLSSVDQQGDFSPVGTDQQVSQTLPPYGVVQFAGVVNNPEGGSTWTTRSTYLRLLHLDPRSRRWRPTCRRIARAMERTEVTLVHSRWPPGSRSPADSTAARGGSRTVLPRR